ncbi:porin [Haematospirillum sp. H1815]|uniref:porin n=1 Tax=Haematospirillum sp. H1815 TaxID=2723108 RepID=UPI001438FF98|nr:porin [Haematospirillum sp. H1815]NKD77720.1 porin [Haematospirillum sp. H1815]
MKKLLIGTSALVAAMTLTGVASAAEPLKLSVGGFGSVFAGYASQNKAYLQALRDAGKGGEVSAVDVKGDNEIHFKAATTLDNGLTVSVKYELEAGGTGEGQKSVDNYSISLGGSFGTVIAGTGDLALAMIANRSPHMGDRLLGAGLADGDLATGVWVLKPESVSGGIATLVNSHNDNESISYVSPSVAGFTFGASYVPDGTEKDDAGKKLKHNPTQPNGTNTMEMYGAGIGYENNFGGLDLKADIGWATADSDAVDSHNEYQAGLQMSYSGVIVGGGYRLIEGKKADKTKDNVHATSWEAGVGYNNGPYGVAIAYANTRVDDGDGYDATTKTNDVNNTRTVQLTSEYKMGPGVMLVGGVGHVKFEKKGSTVAIDKNSGWVAATGLSLAF